MIVLFVTHGIMHKSISLLLSGSSSTFLLVNVAINMPFFIMGMLVGTPLISRFPAGLAKSTSLFVLVLVLVCYYILHSAASSVFPVIVSIVCVLLIYKICLEIERAQYDGITLGCTFARIAAFVGRNSMIIYLGHIICSAGTRAILFKFGISNVQVHVLAGIVAGMFLPLLLVPAGAQLKMYYPRLAPVFLPVRIDRSVRLSQ
jgi:hypothetical protein